MTVTSLFDRQVDRFVENVVRWHHGQGRDQQLEDRIRQQVCGEMLNQGTRTLVDAALNELSGDAAASRLRDLVANCRQHFVLEDRLLSVVAVPVSVKMLSRSDGDVRVSVGRADEIISLGQMMEHILGCRKMVFDRRVYEGKALFSANPKSMLEFCERLEAGEELPEGGPPSAVLSSRAEGAWKMVYLLGVEVRDLDDDLELDYDERQTALLTTRNHAEWALSEMDEVLYSEGAVAEAKCHGMLYLTTALRKGEDLSRGYRLESTMRNFQQGETGVWFRYTYDPTKNCVRLLISGTPMAVEFTWPLFMGERLDGFQHELDRVIDMMVPEDDIQVKMEVPMNEYIQHVREEGLTW